MEHTSEGQLDSIIKLKPAQSNAWAPAAQPFRRVEPGSFESVQSAPLIGIRQPLGKAHACKVSQRTFQQAQDRLKRASRDLGETAAFMLALVTTASAVEAVISIADTKVHFSPGHLKTAFDIYLVLFVSILVLGGLRCWDAIHRRSQAERDIDQAKKGIFEFCPGDQWPKSEE